MAGMIWNDTESGDDLHLAVGFASPRMDQQITVVTDSGDFDGDEPPDGLRLAFKLPPPWINPKTKKPDPHTFTGVQLGTVTGKVSLTAHGKATSFVVQADLVDAGGTPQAPPLFRRIHCHRALSAVWPAPASVVIRAKGFPRRLNVLGKFSDGVIADLTNWLPTTTPAAGHATFVSALGTGTPAMSWELALTDTDGTAELSDFLDPTTGLLKGASTSGTGTLSLLLPPVTGKHPPQVDISYQPAWADTPAEVFFVDGAGLDQVDQVRNVLFLPDGFTCDQQTEFENFVGDLVYHMCHNSAFSPFDVLRDSVNFFRAWLKSTDACVTLASPVTSAVRSMVTLLPDPPALPTAESMVEITRTPMAVLNPRETAFHSIRGARHRAMPELDSGHLVANTWRMTNIDLNDFLGALTGTQKVTAASRWVPPSPDADLVVIICRSAGFAGCTEARGALDTSALGHTCRATTGQGIRQLPTVKADHGLQEDPAGSLRHDSYLVVAPVVHELGHAFGLQDEYGPEGSEGLGMYGKLTDGAIADIRAAPNLLLRDDVLAQPADPDGPPPRLDPGRVTWNWPRIAKAGKVTVPPAAYGTPLDPGDPTFAADGSRVRVSVQRGHDQVLFAASDLVRLRTRPLLGSTLSARHQVTAVSGAWPDQILELRPVTGPTDLLAVGDVERYPTDSVVLAVTSQAADDPGAPDVGLVHPVVLDRIAATSNPLNAGEDTPDNTPCSPSPVSLWQEPHNFPDDVPPNPPALSARLIGIQDGGYGLSCGVYHPSGACAMRGYIIDPNVGLSFTSFCMVCRYALVDRVDPTCHHDIDARYAREYPR